MATIVIKGPDGSEQEQEVVAELSIGRSEGNDLILSEGGGVSRRHARFFVEDGALRLEDTGSANGTWVDGERIAASVTLSLKSQIVIGDYELSVKSVPRASGKAKSVKRGYDDAEDRLTSMGRRPRTTGALPAMRENRIKPSRPRSSAPSTSASPMLKGLSSPIEETVFPLRGLLTVGRVQRSDIQIEDDSVSRKHAEVEVRGREVVLRDLASANGTHVNGEPVADEVTLSHGDIIQFGTVEVLFESGNDKAPAGLARRGKSDEVPARRGARELSPRRGTSSASPPRPAPQSRKLLLIGSAVVLGVLLVAAGIKVMTPAPPPVVVRNTPPPEDEIPEDPAKEIEQLLASARSYSTSELGEPQWDKAEAAVKRVLELEPIHAEGNELQKRIQVEKKCQGWLKKGIEFAALNRADEALEEFGKVKPECNAFFLKSLEAARDSLDVVKKRTGADCKRYATAGKWEQALKSCESYTRLACQTMSEADFAPPFGTKVKLEGPLKKTDWRPKDLLYVNFLKARAKLAQGAAVWVCPEIPAFRPAPVAVDPSKEVKAELLKSAPESSIGRSIVLYFEGASTATVPIQKMRDDMSKSQFHAAGQSVQQDIDLALNLLAKGNSELSNDKIDRAAAVFQQALELDEKLILGTQVMLDKDAKKKELARRNSWLRKTVIQNISERSLARGKDLWERKDYRQACRTWKVGLSFSRSFNDLLNVALDCTKKARDVARSNGSCEELKSGLDFAIDGEGYGDGLREKILELREEKGCQP